MVETKAFALSLSSYVKIYRDEQSKFIRTSILFYLGLFIFAIGVSIYGNIKLGTWETLIPWIPLLIIYGLFLFFIFWFFPIYLYKNKDNKYTFTSRKYRFLEDKLELETAEGVNAEMPYSVLIKKNMGKDYFAFWETSVTAHLIPFEAFESKLDIKAIEKLIEQKYV